MQVMNMMVPRKDRNDESKTYWDPIGTLFVKDGKMWGTIHLGGVQFQVFDRDKKDTGSGGGPFG